jgi:gamma-glutamylaminecyclotransferase
VYGTLKRGFLNHHVLTSFDSATFVSAATTLHRFPLFVDHYRIPYLVDRKGQGHCIVGELWQVDAPTLAALDELEGVSTKRYLRQLADVVRTSTSTRTRTSCSAPEGRSTEDVTDEAEEDSVSAVAAWLYALGDGRPGTDLERRDLLGEYTADHHAGFVVPGGERDPSLRQEWGGYERVEEVDEKVDADAHATDAADAAAPVNDTADAARSATE